MENHNKAIDGVSSIDITTDNLILSTEFYTEILGGKLLHEWSKSFKGDDLYRRIFGNEISKAEKGSKDPKQLGVPDISEMGEYKVSWNFIMFDNIIVKLVEYCKDDGTALSMRDEKTSAAIISNPHLCFWVQDVDLNKFIRAVENEAAKRGMERVFFNRPMAAETEAARAAIPENQLTNYVRGGELSPFNMVYFKGPGGEQMELFQLKDSLSTKWGDVLSAMGVPSTAYMKGYEDNGIKKRIGITSRLYGMNHFGIRVFDLNQSVRFYTQIIGGKLMTFQFNNAKGNSMFHAVFQKELFDTKTLVRSREELCIPDVSDEGKFQISVRFVQIGIATIELIEYTDLDGNGYNPCYDWTSPAYCNTMAVVFSVQEGTDFNQFLHDIEAEAERQGFPEFTINKLPTSVDMRAFRGTPIAGYKYALAKGPSGEQLAFCQFTGSCRKVLHDEIVSYGGVSTMFPDLNTVKQ